MIDIFELYNEVKGRVNSYQTGHLKPSDFKDWVHASQLEVYMENVEAFQRTQVISDYITPFLKTEKIKVENVQGQFYDLVKRPEGYGNYATARLIKVNESDKNENCEPILDEDEKNLAKLNAGKNLYGVPVDLVDNDRFDSIFKHPRKKATVDKPKMTLYSEGFKLVPKGEFQFIEIDFFTIPIKPTFNFTILNSGSETEYFQYNPSQTSKIEFNENVKPILIPKIIQKFATFTGNSQLLNTIK